MQALQFPELKDFLATLPEHLRKDAIEYLLRPGVDGVMVHVVDGESVLTDFGPECEMSVAPTADFDATWHIRCYEKPQLLGPV